MNAEPVIRVDNLTKRFGRQVAVDNVSFQVPARCVFALLGENGAGKSTLIKILLGLVDPDAGSTAILGHDSQFNGLAIRQAIGYVPDSPSLYEWMTVAEIGWFTAGFFPDGFQQHYNELVAGYGLGPAKKLKQLSKGMRAKVALALALAHRPDVLVLDEPTSGLDSLVRREFLESMVDFAGDGRTVFLSSHQIHEVERVADVVAILREGRMLAMERLDELKSKASELIVTRHESSIEPLRLPGSYLTRQVQGRQERIVVCGWSEDQLAELASSDQVSVLDTRSLSLDEIFVA